MTKPDHPEVGRELLAHEIHKGQIVWVQKANRAASLWVWEVGEKLIVFQGGPGYLHFIAQRLPDGRIEDDDKVPMAMYLYLGKP